RPRAARRRGGRSGRATARARSRSRRGTPGPTPREELGGPERDEREQHRHPRQHLRAIVTANLARLEDREREGLRPPGDAAGDHDRRAELAERAREGEHRTGEDAPPREGQRHPEERRQRSTAERARQADEAGDYPPEPASGRVGQEWEGYYSGGEEYCPPCVYDGHTLAFEATAGWRASRR